MDKLIDIKKFQPSYPIHTYPFYHTGKYFEEYFYDFFNKNIDQFNGNLCYLPIFWTNIYLGSSYNTSEIQTFLNSLDKDRRFFTISQHDDAIKETISDNIIHFNMGGNSKRGVCIPLICSSIPDSYKTPLEKDIFCSFVGSNTHETRKIMEETLKDGFFIRIKPWNIKISDNDANEFINITKRSRFTLCPRGYGPTSFRFFETFQLNSVPVYIHDDNKWLPFESFLNYEDFSIIIHKKDIGNLKNILNQIDDNKYNKMLRKGQEVYNKYFNMEALCNKIKDIVNNEY